MQTHKHIQPTSSPPSSASLSDYSVVEGIHDAALNQLREEIKKVMLPLLIRVFELKQASAQQLPSRLQKTVEVSHEEIRKELTILQEDLHRLSLWCKSSQNQVNKALREIDPADDPPAPKPEEKAAPKPSEWRQTIRSWTKL